jgi:hypothetical protein
MAWWREVTDVVFAADMFPSHSAHCNHWALMVTVEDSSSDPIPL